MAALSIVCDGCHGEFPREKSWVLRAKRLGWKTNYCSWECRTNSHNTIYHCNNPSCGKRVVRENNQAVKCQGHYCSRSCAVTVNNSKFPKRPAIIHRCLTCKKPFTGSKKYCSRNCKDIDQTINRDEILAWIRNFYNKEQRIPLKKECPHEKAARAVFGSWNKAIEVAGFLTNPVLFSKKYIAKDGHRCDSLAEKIIDDWLSAKKIIHQVHVRYQGTRFTSDFLVGQTFIEFFGLKGQLKRYDRLMKEKLRWLADQKLKLILIYPADLFPKSKLDLLLGNFMSTSNPTPKGNSQP